MRINNVIEKSLKFEKYIYDQLSDNKTEKETIVLYNRTAETKFRYDIHLPEGIKKLGISPNTYIELKYSPNTLTASRVLQDFLDCGVQDANLYLIVHDLIIPSSYIEDISQKYKDRVKIFEYTKFFEAQSDLDESDTPEKQEDFEPLIKKSSIIENAKCDYEQNKCSLFIGAGLSMDAKLPSWNKLLESLLKQDNRKPYKFLNEANSDAISETFAHSAIISGRYALDGYKSSIENHSSNHINAVEKSKQKQLINHTIINRIRDVLYEDVEENEKKSKLIDSVSSFIKGNNPEQIITYNFDDLIENALNDRTKYKSIYNRNIEKIKGITPIYHVHGMISRDKTIETTIPVLSEKDYHRLYSNLQNWANIIQLHALNSTTCFFIGFSMTDPNQRRLLEFSRMEDVMSKPFEDNNLPHYIFLKKEKLRGEASLDVNQEHWKEMEYMLRDFGLNVIWFNEFSQLPKLLDYISGKSKVKPQID